MAEFKLGRLRFVWKGVWATGTVYVKDDIVRYGGSSYVCVGGHTADADFNLDLLDSKWQAMSLGIEWKNNPWGVDTSYKYGDVVRYGGKTYICVENHTSSATLNGGFYIDELAGKWNLLADGQVWRANWAVNTYYKLGDTVKYNSSSYVCNTPHTSAATLNDGLELDLNKWDLKAEGIKYKSNWQANTPYSVNDIVKYGPNHWICQTHHTSGSTFVNSDWSLFVSGFTWEDEWNSATEYQPGDVVHYGGWSFISLVQSSNNIPPLSPSSWAILNKGYENTGTFNITTAYKVGEVVDYGGNTYVATSEAGIGDTPVTDPGKWKLISRGMRWLGVWSTTPTETVYKVGDTVKYGQSSFICVAEHVPVDEGGVGAPNRPDLDPNGLVWNIVVEGDEANVLLRRADILTRNATQNKRLPKGPTGTFLRAGDQDLEWARVGQIAKVYYVSLDGVDLPTRGTTLNDTWRTIKYACDYIRENVATSVDAPVVIMIKTGVYTETFPISVPKYTSLVGDELRMTIIQPTTETAHLDKFYMRDSTTLRNFTFRGATGAPGTSGLTVANQYNTKRPTGGAWVSLDPGTGPNDEAVWVGQRSPYMQNITLFGDYCVGQKIDGSLHNGGNKSIVSNDFTTILSNGIGAWCANQGRAELVSVFTYYSYIGYLCEAGGVIRATNGNNSYGTYGSVSEGVDPTEISRTAVVDNRRFEALVDRVQTDGEGILFLEYLAPGQSYSTASYNFSGPGSNTISLTPTFNDGAVAEVKVLVDGDGYAGVNNNAQMGDQTYVKLSASDTAVTGAYNGMRITIVDGTGAGQYARINGFDGGTKNLYVLKESFTPIKVASTTVTTNIITVDTGFSTSSLINNMPIMLVGTGFGGLSNSTLYYVKNVVDGTTFTISDTIDINGVAEAEVPLFDAIGTMEAIAVGWDTFIKPKTVSISAITNTNPVRVTTSTSHGLLNRFKVTFASIGGMTELEGVTYYAGRVSASEFDLFTSQQLLTPVDGTGFGTYTTGGTVTSQLLPLDFVDTTSRYYIEPRPVFSTGTGASATAVRTLGIDTVSVSGGKGYTSAPAVQLSGPDTVVGNITAQATTAISGAVYDVIVQNPGTGFTTAPSLTVVGGGLPTTYVDYFAERAVVAGEYIKTTARNIYEVIDGGVLGVTAPNHGSGTSASGTANLLYVGRIASVTATITDAIQSVELLNGGSGFTTPPTVEVGGPGTGAIISAKTSQVITEINMVTNGANYTSPPAVTLVGGDPIEIATATAVLDSSVFSVTIQEGGSGYNESTSIVLAGGAVNAVATVELDNGDFLEGFTPGVITKINIVSGGSGYSSPPVVQIIGTGTDAAATSTIKGVVTRIDITNPGRGYQTTPTVSIVGGGGAGAEATAVKTGSVIELIVVDGGKGYTSNPSLTIVGGGGSNAAGQVTARQSVIDTVTVVDGGDNYTSNPAIAVLGGSGSILRPRIDGQVISVTVTDPGSDYTIDPVISFTGGGNYKSLIAGLKYYLNTSAAIAIGNSQRAQTLAGINYIGTAMKAVANNIDPATIYQTNIDRVAGAISYTPPATISTAIDLWIKTVYAVIENGQNSVNSAALLTLNRRFVKTQVRRYIDNTYTGIADDTWDRDFGLILDAIVDDISTKGVNHTVSCGISQAFLNFRTAEEDKTAIAEAMSYMNTLFRDIVQNIVVVPLYTGAELWKGTWTIAASYAINDVVSANNATYICTEAHTSSVSFTTDLDLNRWTLVEDGQKTQDLAFESESLVAITNNLSIINTLVQTPTGSATFADAATLINDNLSFIKAEVIAYINQTYPNFEYNQVLCARDTGFIVDAVAYDLVNAFVNAEPATSVVTTGVIGKITVDQGGEGYSSGVTIAITGGGAGVGAVAVPIIDTLTGAITGFTMTNKGKDYDTSPLTVAITPDTGSGAIARCKLAGSNVAKVVIIEPGSGYTAGPFLKIVDPNNTIEARFQVRVADGVLGQPEFANRSNGWISAEAAVTGDGFADISQTGSYIWVKELTNLPTPGANIQFEGNSTYYKLVDIRNPVGPTGLLSARSLLLANQSFIEQEVLSYLDNFNYDSVACERDIGLILDALAEDIVYGSNARTLAVLNQYRRGTYSLLENQRFQTAFSLEYLKTLLKQSQKPATLGAMAQLKTQALTAGAGTSEGTLSIGQNADTIIDILTNGLTAVPSVVITDPSTLNVGYADARRLIYANKAFLSAEVIAYITEQIGLGTTGFVGLVYDQETCARDVGYIVDALRYDLTYGGNLMAIQSGQAYFSYSLLQIDSNDRTATLAAYNYLKTLIGSVATNTPVASPKQIAVPQVISGNAGSAPATTAAQTLVEVIRTIVGETGTPAVVNPGTTFVDPALKTARDNLIAAKTDIQLFVLNWIETNYPSLVFNRATCSRDVGLIVDALGWDMMFASNFQSIKAGMSYYRAGANAVINGIGSKANGIDFLIEWIKNEEYFKVVPEPYMPSGNGTAEDNKAKDILLANHNFLIENGYQYFFNNHSILVSDASLIKYDLGQLLTAFAHDLTYTGNAEVVKFAESFYATSALEFPGFAGSSATISPLYIDLVDFMNDQFNNAIQNLPIDREVGLSAVFVQDTTLPVSNASSVAAIDGLTNNFTATISNGVGFVNIIEPSFTNYPAGLTGTRDAIISSKDGLKTAITDWLTDEFVNFTHNTALTIRDAGLIVTSVADDVFGDVANSVEAGQRYFTPTALTLRQTIKPQTIAAMDRINVIAQKVIRNETYVRTQNNAFQERYPALTGGADAAATIKDRIIIIRRILEKGETLQGIKQVLLNNKEYIKAEVIAYVNASYEELNYDQELCARDVGLLIDAYTYDIFGGVSRGREAGLRYYSSASALKAITGDQLAPTKDAILHMREIVKSIIVDALPSITFQETIARSPVGNLYLVEDAADINVHAKIDLITAEILNVIDNGSSALPAGQYSARLQISPPLEISNTPQHATPTTIRSKYSQVRLTGHDFLNVGTGSKSDTNYPGLPVNNPNQLFEIREIGGGRVFYTSTDQDGNFRVGELFRVEQSTGIATLNADAFNLSGLNELALGGITLGGTNAVIREFSTDATFFANSDQIVPTQKAIKTYIQSALGSGGGNIAVNAVIAGSAFLSGDELTTLGNIPFRFTSTGGYQVLSGIESTNATNGSLIVEGGVGINGNLNVSGTTTSNLGTLTATAIQGTPIGTVSASTAKFTTLEATTTATVTGNTASDDTITGALVVTGGVGIGGNVNIGGNLNTAGLTATSLDDTPIGSITRSSGAFTTLASNNQVTFSGAIVSTTTGTGTIVVTGGVGISGAMNIGGSINANGSGATFTANPTGAGGVSLQPAGTGTVTIKPATTVGAIDRMNIGATVAGTGTFTTLSSTSLSVTNTITGSINGNAATVTNGFYTSSTFNLGTTSIAVNRASGTQSLTGVNIDGSAGSATTAGTANALNTGNNYQVSGLWVGGSTASYAAGEIRATSNITAYYSDKRLKENVKTIDNAVAKVMAINGVLFTANAKAEEFGYTDKRQQVGVLAQEIEAVLPEAVTLAPFDIEQAEDGTEHSRSGENYLTVRYEKIVPLLIQAIKEQQAMIEALQKRLGM